jgi:hypothetical protein
LPPLDDLSAQTPATEEISDSDDDVLYEISATPTPDVSVDTVSVQPVRETVQNRSVQAASPTAPSLKRTTPPTGGVSPKAPIRTGGIDDY